MTDSQRYKYKSFNTKDASLYYPGEAAVTDEMTAQRVYTASGAPDVNHDGWDSNGIGFAFVAGDLWRDTSTEIRYSISDVSKGAAVWNTPGSTMSISVISAATGAITKAYNFYSVTYTTTGSVALTLPLAADNIGTTYIVSDSGANAGTNNIVVSRTGTDTMISTATGETSATITSDGIVLKFIAINSTTWKVS